MNVQTTMELYTLKGQILWYGNSILILKKVMEYLEHLGGSVS